MTDHRREQTNHWPDADRPPLYLKSVAEFAR